MRKVKQRTLFYCRLISGRYCPVFVEDGENYIHYRIANREGMLTGKDRWERFYKRVYEIWLDNPSLRN